MLLLRRSRPRSVWEFAFCRCSLRLESLADCGFAVTDIQRQDTSSRLVWSTELLRRFIFRHEPRCWNPMILCDECEVTKESNDVLRPTEIPTLATPQVPRHFVFAFAVLAISA